MYVYASIGMYVHMCIFRYVCIYIRYVCVHVYIGIYRYACVYVCICIYLN